MVEIHHVGHCAAPVSFAFAYVDDYRNATTWMFGLTSLESVTEPQTGLGARYDGTFSVKPIKLASTVEVTEWEQDSVISLKSIKGFPNQSTWRFEPAGDNATRLIILFSYDLPGGIAGKMLGRALEPVVALSVRHSDEALRKHIDAAYLASQA
jgi:uncharacterized membrane protein